MWNFSLFKEKDLIEFLYRGDLEEVLVDLIRQWDYLSPGVHFALVKHLRLSERYFDEEKLAKALGIKKASAKALLENPYVEFEFPAVSERDGKLIRGLAIKDTPEVFCNLPEKKRYITPVVEYLRSKGFVSGSVSVIFDSEFVGNSFQLSLTLALCMDAEKKRLPPNLCWSGGVRKDGRIVKVDSLDKKSEVCERFNMHLAMPFHLPKVDDLLNWLSANIVEVPVAVSIDHLRLEEFFHKEENLLNLKNIHRIDPSKLVIQTGQLSGMGWQETAKRFFGLISLLDYTLIGRLKAHIVVNGPASLSFALGILYGHTRPSVFYHYHSSERKYFPIDLQNTREIKEHTRDYQFVKSELKEGGEDLAVVLFFSHHNPTADVEHFLESKGIKADLLLLTTESSRGNLEPSNFKRIAQEISSAVQEVKGKKAYRAIHFFFSCPVALAYLFGVAFGHYDKGYIYNYSSKDRTYERVLDLEFLRSLREGGYIINMGG